MTRILGLIGEIGAGKSLVAARLAERGARVLDADRAGHETLTQPEVRDELVEKFGSSILGESGQIERKRLAAIVFSDRDALRMLEEVVHPRMKDRFAAAIADARAKKVPLVVLDAAILVEAGWAGLCDHILLVTAPRTVRLERVRSSRGWTDDELAAREKMQMPLDRKRSVSQTVLENAGSPVECLRRVDQLFEFLTGSSKSEVNLSDSPKDP